MDSSHELKVKDSTTNSDYQSELNNLRTQIDELDRRLLNILKERMSISAKVCELKKKFDKPILQPHRMEIVLEQFKAAGSALGLSQEFSAQIFKVIHDESVDIQNKINNLN